MNDNSPTMHFSMNKEEPNPARDSIKLVCSSMKKKGYNPVSQFVGYIISGDPTYITSYKNSRAIISRLDRDELLEEFVSEYIKSLNDY